MRLEQKIASLLPEGEVFDVIAHELWRDGEGGWSVNDSWKIAKEVDKEGVLEAARGRWEVFKVNYMAKARVKNIVNIADCEDEVMLEVNCVAFLDIIKVK